MAEDVGTDPARRAARLPDAGDAAARRRQGVAKP